ncbi:hypothetical protein ASF12_06940 [Paenibacillus sp. Leaf72]|nr:hypothetical protein ASF12_06940 [Paenibacillus sp. Leaf72]
MNPFIDVAAAAITPTTVTFTTNEATAWNDGIAEDGEGGSANIAGINMQFYNISDTSGTIIPEKLIHGDTQQSDSFHALTSYASNIASGWKGMGMQSSDGAEFRLKEFFYSNWGGSASITVVGYRNGTEVGNTSFTTDELVNNYDSKTVILGSAFYNVDKVLLYSTGPTWHGINNIQIDEPIITNAAPPTIGTQPTDKTVNVGGSASLSVAASGGATLSYQWYSNSTNSNVGGSLIGGATSASYSAPTSSAGTTYYYAVVTNTDSSASGNQTATATSNAAKVTVNALTHAATPTINTQPTDKTVNVGDSANLSVAASGGAALSYQWYSNSTNSNVGGTLVGGATNASYSAPTSSAGTTYYYVVVTNTDSSATGNQTAMATSNAAKVTVISLTHAATPTINTQPTDKTVNVGDSANLSVAASGGAALSYQWYSNSTNSNVGGTLIGSATSASYAAPTSSAGTAYYYVVITNTDSSATGNQTATATSNVATVTVIALTNASTPTIDTHRQ